MTLSELFDQILERPALYVGNISIIRINAFIQGYWYAKLLAKEEVKDDLYGGFTAWVAKRFQIDSMHDWESIIRFMALSELRAFEMTKELWAEYKAQFRART